MQKPTLTREERQARIKESRQMYGRKPPRRSRSLEQIAPRTSIAPGLKTSGSITTKPLTRPVPFKFNHTGSYKAPNLSRTVDDDFKIDHRSMEMIESGNVIIPPVSRPSNYGTAPRSTFHANRFRPSIAASQEPRASLLPLGINIFQATEAERALVNDWMKQKATPAGKKKMPESMKSAQKVRFQPSPVTENPEEEPEEKVEEKSHQKAATPYVHKYDAAKRSALKQTDQLNNCLAAARKLNFDDTTLDESVKENSKALEDNSATNLLRTIQKIADDGLTILNTHKFSPNELKSLDACLEVLNTLKFKNKIDMSKTRQLVPISENEVDEEEEVSIQFESLQLKTRFAERRLPDF
uniref:DASH complex subunit DAM1 n=1 Tax=Caenorhabditis tropicalis TaxID=1561998 RepID=A0A1I7TA86_9PELO